MKREVPPKVKKIHALVEEYNYEKDHYDLIIGVFCLCYLQTRDDVIELLTKLK